MNSRLTDEKKIAALDKKIELLQEKVVQKHREYDALTTELHELLNERYWEYPKVCVNLQTDVR